MKKQFCSLKKYTTVFSDFSSHRVCKFYCGQAFFYRKIVLKTIVMSCKSLVTGEGKKKVYIQWKISIAIWEIFRNDKSVCDDELEFTHVQRLFWQWHFLFNADLNLPIFYVFYMQR